MGIERLLAEMGAVPRGVQPKTILEEGGTPQWADTGTLANLDRGLQAFIQKNKERIQKDMEEKKKRTELYRVLRDAGYDKDKAYEFAIKGEGAMTKPEGEISTTKEYKKTATEEWRDDLRSAKKGEITWDEIKDKYPEPTKQKQIEEVRKSTLPELKKSPDFRMGTGGLISKVKSWRSPMQAELNEVSLKVIQNIKNEEDLTELIRDKKLYEAQGVDVAAILEYFGATKDGKIIDYTQIPGT